MASGSNAFKCGKLQMCATLYKNTIKIALRDKKLIRMPQHLVEELENGLKTSSECENQSDAIWNLRHTLDVVYDEYVDMYCGVTDAKFNPIHLAISNAISLGMVLRGDKREEHQRDLYQKLAKDILGVPTLSNESKSMVRSALEVDGDEDKRGTQVFALRKALDYVYDEVRLPDMHKKLLESTSVDEMKKKEEFLLDFTKKNETLMTFTPKILNDTVMGGKSTSELKLKDDVAEFCGSVSTESNGGFASIKFHPHNVEKLRDALKGCAGFTVVAKNLAEKVQRFKFQLVSVKKMRAFNYQSEIMLPPSSEFVPVFLHISTFWPTMFGHVLADQGKVDTSAVDAIGFLISKLCDDGKPNPDFNEGDFSIAIESVKIVY